MTKTKLSTISSPKIKKEKREVFEVVLIVVRNVGDIILVTVKLIEKFIL